MQRQPETTRSPIHAFEWFFLLAALYDLVLGIAFFLFYRPIFDALGADPPRDLSYVHVTAGFVAVQGLGYYFVWRNPLRNVDIVKVGAVYKLVYTAVALYYLVDGTLPHRVFAWFAVFDLIFLIGFVRFLATARSIATEQRPAPRPAAPDTHG